jgi:hypothetical protein
MRIDLSVSRHPAAVEFIANHCSGVPSWEMSDGPEGVQAYHDGSHPSHITGVRLYYRGVGDTDADKQVVCQRVIPVLASATPDDVRGKTVAGNLPLHLAALCQTVYAIEFDGPPPRGQEYTLADMHAAGARLVPYRVTALD